MSEKSIEELLNTSYSAEPTLSGVSTQLAVRTAEDLANIQTSIENCRNFVNSLQTKKATDVISPEIFVNEFTEILSIPMRYG